MRSPSEFSDIRGRGFVGCGQARALGGGSLADVHKKTKKTTMDWIPNDQPTFDEMLANYRGKIQLNPASFGVSTDKFNTFHALVSNYFIAAGAKDTHEQNGTTVYQLHRDAKEAVIAEWRILDGEIMSRRETTNAQRTDLGRAVPDDTRTAATASLTQIIHWVDAPPRQQSQTRRRQTRHPILQSRHRPREQRRTRRNRQRHRQPLHASLPRRLRQQNRLLGNPLGNAKGDRGPMSATGAGRSRRESSSPNGWEMFLVDNGELGDYVYAQ